MTYIVVGGGVIGASVAYHLSERTDAPVTVFERSDSLFSETTAKSSAGFRHYADHEVKVRMRRYAKRLYNEFLADSMTDGRYVSQEFVEVATTEEGADAVRRGVEAGAAAGSSAAEYLGGDELDEVVLAPGLDTSSVVGAAYRPNSGFFESPEMVGYEFADRAAENGVTFETDAPVSDVTTDDGRVTGVVVGGERVEATTVICAAGPWNVRLARGVGIDLPVHHTPVRLLEFEPEDSSGSLLPRVVHRESGATFGGRLDGRVINYQTGPTEYDERAPLTRYEMGREHDPDALDRTVPADHQRRIREVGTTLLPCIADAELVGEDVCLLSRTPDAKPIVGWTEIEGFSIAALASKGIQYAPAIGRVVTSQLVDGDPTDYYDALSIARFEGHDDTVTVVG